MDTAVQEGDLGDPTITPTAASRPQNPASQSPRPTADDRDQRLEDVQPRRQHELLVRPQHRDQEALVPLQQAPGPRRPPAPRSTRRRRGSPATSEGLEVQAPGQQPQGVGQAGQGVGGVGDVGDVAGLGLAPRRRGGSGSPARRPGPRPGSSDWCCRGRAAGRCRPRAASGSRPPAEHQRRDRPQGPLDLPAQGDDQAVADRPAALGRGRRRGLGWGELRHVRAGRVSDRHSSATQNCDS